MKTESIFLIFPFASGTNVAQHNPVTSFSLKLWYFVHHGFLHQFWFFANCVKIPYILFTASGISLNFAPEVNMALSLPYSWPCLAPPNSWALWPLSLGPASRQTWWSPMWLLIIWATWGKRLNLYDPQLPHLLRRITVVAATQAVGRIQWATLGHVAVNPEPASSQRPVTAFVSAVLDSEPSSDLEGCIYAAY